MIGKKEWKGKGKGRKKLGERIRKGSWKGNGSPSNPI